MIDQFNELTTAESLREECRSLLAQLKVTQTACKNSRIDELNKIYDLFVAEPMIWCHSIQVSELADYLADRISEIKEG